MDTDTLFDRGLDLIGRWLYPPQLAIVPGEFETFLSGIAEVPPAAH